MAFAREHEVILVHDFAYADIGFDGYEPPSILQVPGAKDVAVELYTMTKSFSMAGWRVGFVVGNSEIVQALTKLKTYLDYGTFQPIQIAAIVAMNEAPDYPAVINKIYNPAVTRCATASIASVGVSSPRRGRCSCGRRYPSPIARWAHSNSPNIWSKRPMSRRRPAWGSAPVVTATCGSPSSRTSNASARPCATCAAR